MITGRVNIRRAGLFLILAGLGGWAFMEHRRNAPGTQYGVHPNPVPRLPGARDRPARATDERQIPVSGGQAGPGNGTREAKKIQTLEGIPAEFGSRLRLDLFGMSSGLINEEELTRFGLSVSQIEVVKKSYADALFQMQDAEGKTARFEIRDDVPGITIPRLTDAKSIKEECYSSLAASIPDSRADVILANLEKSSLIKYFGNRERRIEPFEWRLGEKIEKKGGHISVIEMKEDGTTYTEGATSSLEFLSARYGKMLNSIPEAAQLFELPTDD